MRVLFLTPHPREGASSRYRVLQYIPHFEAMGIQCTVSPFLSESFYRIAYHPGHWVRKAGYLIASSARRLRDLARSGRYDVVFIHLEAFPLGPPLCEWLLALRNIPIVFDLDDAIFLRRRYAGSALLTWLRMPHKLPAILRRSHSVITCNDYLRQYARQHNPNVHMIPTCVDVTQFTIPATTPQRARPVLGWIGSHSTAPYLEILRPVLTRLAQHHAFTFHVIGAGTPFHLPGVDVRQTPWSLAQDVACFQDLDIGVYPLPDEPWVSGKTGFKTVQYMAVGVPCVVSAIGRNLEIIHDGRNGFLARTTDEWCDKLGRLLTDEGLRQRLGAAGRQTVEERFAAHRYVASYVRLLREAAGGEPVGCQQGAQRVEPVPHAQDVVRGGASSDR